LIFMSNRDYQAIAKMLEEIEVIEDLISDSNLTGEFRESHTHISWKAIPKRLRTSIKDLGSNSATPSRQSQYRFLRASGTCQLPCDLA
jgi:hypothetical protein